MTKCRGAETNPRITSVPEMLVGGPDANIVLRRREGAPPRYHRERRVISKSPRYQRVRRVIVITSLSPAATLDRHDRFARSTLTAVFHVPADFLRPTTKPRSRCKTTPENSSTCTARGNGELRPGQGMFLGVRKSLPRPRTDVRK